MGGIITLVLFGLLALASVNGCESTFGTGADGEPDFDFGTAEGDVNGGDGLPTCDGVVVVELSSGAVQVPGDTGFFGTDSSACEMSVGQGDEDAVVVLQDALLRCNRQSVAVDGDYGPETAAAVIQVQQRAGIAADGEYGPATLQSMRWPTTASSGASDCVTGVSQTAIVGEESSSGSSSGSSSPLPPTG